MTPAKLIDEVVQTFGQLAGRRDLVFERLKAILDLLERYEPLSYQIDIYHTNYTANSYLPELNSIPGIGVATLSFQTGGSGYDLIRVEYGIFEHYRNTLHPAIYYTVRERGEECDIVFPQDGFNRDEDGALVVRYFKKSDLGSDETQNFDFLDLRYPRLKIELLKEIAYMLKDERMGVGNEKGRNTG